MMKVNVKQSLLPSQPIESIHHWNLLKTHNSFAYVTNVPRPVFDNELGQFDNPLHCHEVSEIVDNALNVSVENVFSSTMTSAFVGFADTKSASGK